MKKTHIKPILEALLADREITAEEVNTVLRDGKQSDRPYGPILMQAAMDAYK